MDYAGIQNDQNLNEQLTLVDKVENDLLHFFHSQQYKAGDVILTEVELATQLSVSRTVIREAMLRLRMRGLIESRKKRGTVITNPDLLSILEKTMHPGILDNETLRDIFELRLVLEIGMADLLFERVTPADVEELYAIVADEPLNTENMFFDAEREVRFHGKLYDIAGNQTLRRFQRMLLPSFDFVHKSGLLKKPVQHKKFVSHRGLIDVIQFGTPETFRSAMRNHFEPHFQRLF
ncbi:FCD domain-containing protein (plasmid) [Hymenobacter tibetensis]|uniref:FCD domain-containing protein n=1 Tax=Hymenobacter tibetensis TaxID=497967 RepID=A0ABY4D4S3_9BACT|nr:FCD domain-containing protein [Hymenobacter tibetensis]UOG77450.1 FCD domain-containing protein [Hymenobacter tibetensis]